MDVGKIMKQAQKMQEQLGRIQEELARRTVAASAGGGMVTVIANGRQEIISIKIAPEAVDPQEIAMLEDLVTAAVNEALRSARSLMEEEMKKITGGLSIPGITT